MFKSSMAGLDRHTQVILFNTPCSLTQLEKQAQEEWEHQDVTLLWIPEGHVTTMLLLNVSITGNPGHQGYIQLCERRTSGRRETGIGRGS